MKIKEDLKEIRELKEKIEDLFVKRGQASYDGRSSIHHRLTKKIDKLKQKAKQIYEKYKDVEVGCGEHTGYVCVRDGWLCPNCKDIQEIRKIAKEKLR